MKKIIALLLIAAMTLCCFAGCGGTKNAADIGKLKIVCTIFPLYDWVKNILGDEAANADLTLLLDSGTDLHSFQPTAADILTVTGSDLFVYVGGESDKWVEDIFGTTDSKAVKLSMMDVLGENVVEEEVVEGMQEEAEEEEEEDHGVPEVEYDEHVWLSLKNADKLCAAIQDALVGLDPAHRDAYESHCWDYRQNLVALDAQYAEAVKTGARKAVLFADRFPFRYMVDDYGLDYYAAFVGCSAETEASFETISFLANKADELALPVLLVTETSDMSIANTVKSTSQSKDQQILVMNAMQSVTADKLDTGVTYLQTMKDNLEVLKQALN
jgi:zinc transport system substrate-binding protein